MLLLLLLLLSPSNNISVAATIVATSAVKSAKCVASQLLAGFFGWLTSRLAAELLNAKQMYICMFVCSICVRTTRPFSWYFDLFYNLKFVLLCSLLINFAVCFFLLPFSVFGCALMQTYIHTVIHISICTNTNVYIHMYVWLLRPSHINNIHTHVYK